MKRIILFLSLASTLLITSFLLSTTVNAATECGGVKTSVIKCDSGSNPSNIEESAIWDLLQMSVNILSGGVAVAAVIGLVYGGIIYSSAQDNQSQVQKAIGIIRNVVIGIIAYVLMYSILQFIIPGGIF